MSSIVTNNTRRGQDHFEPEPQLDPAAQRRLRGQLEKIDYTAFACNREVLASNLGRVSAEQFQMLALSTAQARAHWVQEALAQTGQGGRVPPDGVARLAALRQAYEELTAAYESLRRMVERGYLSF